MDKKSQIVLVLGLVITIILLMINIYLAGIVFILMITLFISWQIMQDSQYRPDLAVSLSDDAKSIIIKNSGNATAVNIHVALVPMDTEYTIPSLTVDESHSYKLEKMIQEVKVVITFENEENGGFTETVSLSPLGNEYDPLKPVIPLFKWK